MPRILLTEDEDVNREMLTQWLEDEGYDVLHADDGAKCVAAAARERPDLILLDMQMPVMNGFEAAALLKADAATRPIPVIALTAFSMPGDKQKTLAAGCDDYHSKPVDFDRLRTQMQHWLSGGASA